MDRERPKPGLGTLGTAPVGASLGRREAHARRQPGERPL